MAALIGIYCIKSPSGKVYIGSSLNINRRWNYYKNYNCREQRKLYYSLKKYGVENHIFEVLEECNIEDLFHKEHFWQKKFNSVEEGLNCVYERSVNIKKEFSKETRDRISKSKKGHTPWNKGLKTNKLADNRKIILDVSCGVFYESITEVANLYGKNRQTLSAMLNGQNKNRTNLIII